LKQSIGLGAIQGNYVSAEGHELSAFAADGNLFFQWNKKRWSFNDLPGKIAYRHDLQNKMTTFSVESESIQYPAWWRDDPGFSPFLPERDEDEDFFGYIFSLAHDQELQKILIKSWSK
jgi:hypothetical protein